MTKEIENQEMSVTVQASTYRQKYKAILVKVSAPKELFEVTELLSRKGVYPTLQSFLESEVKRLLKDYSEKADALLQKAVSKKEISSISDTP